MKKKIFQFPDGGADAVLFWIDEAGEIGTDSDDANALNYVETANLTRKIDFGSPELYAHIFYEYDSDYEDAFFTLVSVTRGAAPPFEGWDVEVLVEPEKAWRPSGRSADGVVF